MGTKESLTDMTSLLFEQLERLGNSDLTTEELQEEGGEAMKRCVVCGKAILNDSRNYEKRLEAFRTATGDEGDFCDDCMKAYFRYSLQRAVQRVSGILAMRNAMRKRGEDPDQIPDTKILSEEESV